MKVPIVYDGVELDEGFRIDLLVNDAVIVEVKAVDKLHPVCQAQVKTYLRLTNKRVAFLVNFNVLRITGRSAADRPLATASCIPSCPSC